jgi:hypothetical protein
VTSCYRATTSEVGSTEEYWHNEMAQAGLEHAYDELSYEHLEWLDGLPPMKKAFDNRLLFVHSHPEETDRYVSKSELIAVATVAILSAMP